MSADADDAPPSLPLASSSPPPLPHSSNCTCTLCGDRFPSRELLQFDQQLVCAACKPRYLQQLREGVRADATVAVAYAGFWIRSLAIVIDGLLLWSVEAVLWRASGETWADAFGVTGPYPNVMEWGFEDWLWWMVRLVVAIAYFTIMMTKYGGSVGKLVLGLRVVNADGGPLVWTTALWRDLATYLSGLAFVVNLPDAATLALLPCLAGYVMAAFDREKRALHDRLCGTRVIRRRRPRDWAEGS